MVRPVDRSSGSHHPQSVTRGQGAQAKPSEGVQSLANRIRNLAPASISVAGKHAFTRKPADVSLTKDAQKVASQALKFVGQVFKKAR